MRDSESQSTKTAPLLHLFNRNKASTVRFEEDVLTVWAKSGRIAQSVKADEIREVKLQKLPARQPAHRPDQQGRTITVNGLERSTSERLHSQLQNRVEEILNDEAVRKATVLGPQITDLRDSITSYLSPDRFIRRSHAADMTQVHSETETAVGRKARRKLNTDASQATRWLESTTNAEALEGTRAALNETFLEASVPMVPRCHQRHAEERVEPMSKLEHRHRRGRHPGPGRRRHRKTAVITGEIAHLVPDLDVPPSPS